MLTYQHCINRLNKLFKLIGEKMRKIKIVTDSSSDILDLPSVPFAYAPMKIITLEREFVDDRSLDVDKMSDFLDSYKGKSQSSCPNTNDWLDAFGDADDVFCITITSALSGSYNSACLAKQIYESNGSGKRVFVIDSLSAGPEITLIVEKIREYIECGTAYEDICEKITEYIKHTALIFMLKSLKTFANNGRVSPLVARLVGIAGICIVGKASSEGTLEPRHKCRGERRSLDALIDELEAHGYRSGKISIGHCQNIGAAIALRNLILQKHRDAKIEIHSLRGLCSFYAEKGGLLVGFERS